MTDQSESVASILRNCEHSHCHRLLLYHTSDSIGIDSLSYEDVFYPLRHHRKDGLILEVKDTGFSYYIQYGPGNLFYHNPEPNKSPSTSIHSMRIYNQARAGDIEITPRLKANVNPEEDIHYVP